VKVLISWSGERSAQIARLLRDWLPGVLPDIEPWMSAHDLRKGGRWAHDLTHQLSETHFGLIVVLPENKNSAWLNFEAGAISKWVEFANVAPVLFGLEVSELTGPLAQFQGTVFTKEDFVRLLMSIASATGKPIVEVAIERTLNFSWSALLDRIGAILRMPVPMSESSSVDAVNDEGALDEEKAAVVIQIGTSSDNFMTEQDVVQAVQMKRAKVQLFLAELTQAGYLAVENAPMIGDCYRVIGKGVKYMMKRGLL
jgi:hypothetical protein